MPIVYVEEHLHFRTLARGTICLAAALTALPVAVLNGQQQQNNSRPRRNVIIFVADGLRHGSVNAYDSPTLAYIRERGVNFNNSHALFPTFTTANASAIATGHKLGDTGDFSNTLYSGYPVFNTGNFGKTPGTVTPFVENNQILADLDDHYNGNYLNEESIMAVARNHGYNTASIGKVGPVAIQDVTELRPVGQQFPTPNTIFIDDSTGTTGIPLSQELQGTLTDLGLPTIAPTRSNGCGPTDQCNNGFSGNNTTPGTTAANVTQQQYFVDALTKAVLPTFRRTGQPFFVVYWSRDPDGSQHNQGDSLNSLTPGINGPTSRAGVMNADNNLRQILDYVQSQPELRNNTDIIVTADHGFSAISHHDLDASGTKFVNDYSSTFIYKDATGRQEVNTGFLPVGFIAIDLAHELALPLFDPDAQITNNGTASYKSVDPTIGQTNAAVSQRPASGDGLIGGTGKVQNQVDAEVIVAANGGSDLIYVPSKDRKTVARIVRFLSRQDYTGGLFVDESIGEFPGALPLNSIGLSGSSPLPRPTIVINFLSFATNSLDKVNSRVEFADSTLQQGQGMHGNLSRADTFNNMAALGPDFKNRFTDSAPVANVDLAPTLATILGFDLPSNGELTGRVVWEALRGGTRRAESHRHKWVSTPTGRGVSTVLLYQQFGDKTYYDEACIADYFEAQNRRNPCR